MKRDATGFDRIATRIFSPLYPVIAERLLLWSGKRDGLCVDLGTGPGLLAIALARTSGMDVLALDLSAEMLGFAGGHIRDAGLEDRVFPLLGDVHTLPFRDGTVDLFVSRGSIFFWEDRVRAFAETYRALAPGGVAYLGGSFGTKALKEEIFQKMREVNPDWDRDVGRRSGRADPAALLSDLARAGLFSARIKEDEAGFWVEIRKP
ncbi:class I SAM-dependent methyltransferase [uncultured Methanofollis sp.]|uniref:class I SAM-dependent methyltransferase n=1 Tax=uncultured Methanofollis sp. TaxID=262500 RepID=UPI00262ABE41|nr:class I SAM-dependent methyltransferase [uncultured Methanofollis sp.]